MTTGPEQGGERLGAAADHPYFVVGGRYSDTSFTKLLEPAPAEGPYLRYDDAVDVWRANSMRHIDEAFVRYVIVQADSLEAASEQAEEPPATPTVQSA
jgi:hypothetical protein